MILKLLTKRQINQKTYNKIGWVDPVDVSQQNTENAECNVEFSINTFSALSLKDILALDDNLRKTKGVSLLTPHARILFWLRVEGTSLINDALIASKASYANFFNVLRRLKMENLILAEKDDTDSRVRRLSLNCEINPEDGVSLQQETPPL